MSARSKDTAAPANRSAPAHVVAVVVTCLVLLVASGGVLVSAAVAGSGDDTPDVGTLAQDEGAELENRRAALEVAQAYFVQGNNFDARDVEDLEARLTPLMTKEHARRTTQEMDVALAPTAEFDQTQKAIVKVAAVLGIDDDSARVLVAGDGEARSTLIRRVFYSHWEVSLVRSDDGSWLVDDHVDLGQRAVVVDG